MTEAAENFRQCRVDRVSMAHPGDVTAIARLFDEENLDPASVAAVLGKTEGNGCVNDFSRPYAVTALQTMFAERLGCPPAEVGKRIAFIMSGGTEGGISPHFIVFSVSKSAKPADGSPSLAIGTAFTADFVPEEIGGLAQAEATAVAVKVAMKSASIARPEDVHLVQIKCPLLTSARIADAKARGHRVATEDTYASMGLSRGASALGVALALDEIGAKSLSDSAICQNFSLWSGRASTSAGIELMRNEVVVMGNSSAWTGGALIAHAVMQDGIDFGAVQNALRSAGVHTEGQLSADEAKRIRAVFAKAEPPRNGAIRGNRHIMWDDSDINATRHARALVGGVIAAAIGRTDLFISGGAEHQGPDGGGPIAIIATKKSTKTGGPELPRGTIAVVNGIQP
jgi:cyanuric acid amidohydrolase